MSFKWNCWTHKVGAAERSFRGGEGAFIISCVPTWYFFSFHKIFKRKRKASEAEGPCSRQKRETEGETSRRAESIEKQHDLVFLNFDLLF